MSGNLSVESRSFAAQRPSPKRRFGKIGRRTSDDGCQQSGSERTVTRQPCKSRLRNHSNRLSSVFLRGTSGSMASSVQSKKASTISTSTIAEDPSELSNHVTAPGVLKIFGSEICQGAHYKSVLATTQSSAKELVKEALERYGLSKEEADSYVLCDAIGCVSERQWKTEAFRVVGDNEKPLLLQSLWKPREGLARRFEIQKRSCVEERALRERDTVTAGINAQARKLQKSRSRVTSTLTERSGGRSKLWRSKSSTDMLDRDADKSPAHQSQNSLQIFEFPQTGPEQRHIEARSEEATTEALCEREAGEWEREETESSGDSGAQYSIHPPHDCPYLLLLRGRSHAQDFLIYLLTGPNITAGRTCDLNREPKVDIVLSADDILPTHCHFHRHQNGCPTTLLPCPSSVVTRNGEPLSSEVTLHSGDVIGLGHSYVFMFKEPAGSSQQDSFPSEPWLLLTHSPTAPDEVILCDTCLSTAASHGPPPAFRSSDGRELTIRFSPHALDDVAKEIVAMGLHSAHRPPLTVAFLLSTCIQYCATSLQASQLRRLLLLTASHLQSSVWELTRDLAAVQPEHLEAEELQSLKLDPVISGLRPLVVWMSNSLELLHFIQFQLPVLLDWRSRKEQSQVEDTEHSLVFQIYLSCVQSAVEEAVTVLEEIIMLAFQQCVYYITKVLYPLLPVVLDCNPFRGSPDTPEPTESAPVPGPPAVRVPQEVQQVVDVLDRTWRLLKESQLHPDISAQLVGYLFYFINASLFNSLMERGSEAGFYQWSRGVHLRASLDLILDWAHETGLGELALEQCLKLSCAINLLATPRKSLTKTDWSSLRSLYPALHPAQLHHLLSLYRPLSQDQSTWRPTAPEQDAARSTCDVLESFDTHHPLVVPDGGYHFHLEAPVCECECELREQLEELRHFICHTQTQIASKPDSSTPPPSPSAAGCCDSSSCDAVLLLSQKLHQLELQSRRDDSSGPKDLTKSCGTNGDVIREGESVCEAVADSSSVKTAPVQLKEEEEQEEVFSLELERGHRGIGLALVDSWDSAATVKGLFVRAVLPDSPAALSEKLLPGDRILAVNGVSLLGLDYHSGKELIQSSGDRVRLLVNRSDQT
ncbi:hypothetical protein WMY93_010111 [Mugilogobius chulae]|uniref:Uncharacterized protein n=1 Tax=Mugilogobius chulae TaxID=88201 RepID=A0AAW0PFC5_9GOBI